MNSILTGFRTVLVGLVVAVGPAALSYLTSIDPVKTFGLSPTAGAIIGALMIGLRAITNTTVLTSTSPAPSPSPK